MAPYETESFNKYRGRKFLITCGTILLASALAYVGKMDSNVALVFSTAIGSFNFALRNSG